MSTMHVAKPAKAAGEALGALSSDAKSRIEQLRQYLELVSGNRTSAADGFRIYIQSLTDEEAEIREELSQLTGKPMPEPSPESESQSDDCDEVREELSRVTRERNAAQSEAEELEQRLDTSKADLREVEHQRDEAREALRARSRDITSDGDAERLRTEIANQRRQRSDDATQWGSEKNELTKVISRLRQENDGLIEANNRLQNATPAGGTPPVQPHPMDVRRWSSRQMLVAFLGLAIGLVVASVTHGFDSLRGAGHGVLTAAWFVALGGIGFCGGAEIERWFTKFMNRRRQS